MRPDRPARCIGLPSPGAWCGGGGGARGVGGGEHGGGVGGCIPAPCHGHPWVCAVLPVDSGSECGEDREDLEVADGNHMDLVSSAASTSTPPLAVHSSQAPYSCGGSETRSEASGPSEPHSEARNEAPN
mmetsp:Transcript_24828/g.51612  ORF Transcript_24828/g.51612 Transcript_24828/m.51612 type:complete len:129 (+) Transcript_24828:38-424(+)